MYLNIFQNVQLFFFFSFCSFFLLFTFYFFLFLTIFAFLTTRRKRTRLLMEWIDSRDLHRFERHCFTTKGDICSFLRSNHFSRCPPTQSSTYPTLFVDALAFLLSTGAREQASSSLIRDSGLGDVVQRAVCSRSLELHARRWPPYEPSCFSPCQACCSRLLFSLSHTAKRILCTIDDSRGLSQSRTRFLTPSRFTVFDI